VKIYIAGHNGMVGGAILRQLHSRQRAGEDITLVTRMSGDLDLTDQSAVRDFMQAKRPDQVILAAAKVGGIHANNTYPADFIYKNLMIECNVIHQAFDAGVFVHLPQVRTAADGGKCAINEHIRADERALCRGQNRRH
jgi:GDP-L-fucose synthase